MSDPKAPFSLAQLEQATARCSLFATRSYGLTHTALQVPLTCRLQADPAEQAVPVPGQVPQPGGPVRSARQEPACTGVGSTQRCMLSSSQAP